MNDKKTPLVRHDTNCEHIASLCVSRVPIFKHLPYDELAIIADKAATRVYERGEFVHRAGEPSDKLFIVHTGQVKVYRLSESGKEQLVRILRPGDLPGRTCFHLLSKIPTPKSRKLLRSARFIKPICKSCCASIRTSVCIY